MGYWIRITSNFIRCSQIIVDEPHFKNQKCDIAVHFGMLGRWIKVNMLILPILILKLVVMAMSLERPNKDGQIGNHSLLQPMQHLSQTLLQFSDIVTPLAASIHSGERKATVWCLSDVCLSVPFLVMLTRLWLISSAPWRGQHPFRPFCPVVDTFVIIAAAPFPCQEAAQLCGDTNSLISPCQMKAS